MGFLKKEYVEGLGDVLRQLDVVKNSLRNKHLRKAMADVSRNVLWSARARTPKRRGILYRSLGRKVRVYRKSGVVVAVVGARVGFKEQVGVRKRDSRSGVKYPRHAGDPVFADPTKYLHLVELGTRRTQAAHMLRDAAAAARPMMTRRVVEAVNAALAEAASRRGGGR